MNRAPQIKDFWLKWRVGARTAAVIVQVARRFSSGITLSSHSEDRERFCMPVAAKDDLMGVLVLLGGADHDHKLECKFCGALASEDAHDKRDSRPSDRSVTVTADGSDAAAAMEAMTELFSC